MEGVGVVAGVDVAGTLSGDGVAVGDDRTVLCGAGVSVADLVRSARGPARLGNDRGGLAVREAAGRRFAGASLGEVAFGGLTVA